MKILDKISWILKFIFEKLTMKEILRIDYKWRVSGGNQVDGLPPAWHTAPESIGLILHLRRFVIFLSLFQVRLKLVSRRTCCTCRACHVASVIRCLGCVLCVAPVTPAVLHLSPPACVANISFQGRFTWNYKARHLFFEILKNNEDIEKYDEHF